MVNLLIETQAVMVEEFGHAPSDIVFIGSTKTGHSCSWEEFEKLADREYDDGFGAQEVAMDLEIHFKGGAAMRRHEYDGSEGWSYVPAFAAPSKILPISSLFVCGGQIGWESLASTSDPGGEDGQD